MHIVFGSQDSIDTDVMLFVDRIGTVSEANQTIEGCVLLSDGKRLNVNLAVVADGIIVDVFKGTADEANNSVLQTYRLHDQVHQCPIVKMLPRDAGIKNLRAMRAICSFISRTEMRAQVKTALKGSAVDKYNFLLGCELDSIVDLGSKNSNLVDFHKMLAFQMGQAYLLNKSIEVYTKQDIAAQLEELRPALERSGVVQFDQFKKQWLSSFDPKSIPQFEVLKK